MTLPSFAVMRTPSPPLRVNVASPLSTRAELIFVVSDRIVSVAETVILNAPPPLTRTLK